ncbi:glutathione S-transferase [Bradyrhizobium prioriisuperbiae]|uniref:glutathione S-transferase family protein n=1 Tax=Bradyrhizobium prioriisuperbiae TaxID=2854389 RepID=UPI0028EB9801|nr:glutathione S-transferase [Bradyrhizobium prioritasuperba]
MRLIGMLDSPYVRRVAVSLKCLRLPFIHEPVSVFSHFDAFAGINPVVKAPTLVLDDGTTLMDSSLILEHLERLAPPEHRLMPADLADHARVQRLTGLALAACEKTVQIVYEHELRPIEKRHQPWIDRVHGQLLAAYRQLDAEIGSGRAWLVGTQITQADICAAVAWRFTQSMLADQVRRDGHWALTRLSERMEALPEFASTPAE